MRTLLCYSCQQVKPIHRFSACIKPGRKPTYHRRCKECRAAATRQKYREDPRYQARRLVVAMNSRKQVGRLKLDVDAASEMLLVATHCHYCQFPAGEGIPFTLDYLTPLKQGGQNVIENVVACCEPCAQMKAKADDAAYCKWLGHLLGQESQSSQAI